MNLTLESIQAEQSKLAAMIAKFAEQSITEYIFPRAEIALKPGEHYAGIILGKDGEASYHLILLAESRESIKWKDALDWAESINGELPTHREQSLLFANLKEQFESEWYWSSEQSATNSSDAWCQHFSGGDHDGLIKTFELRARAVRRLEIL
jgi:hypothetical protein